MCFLPDNKLFVLVCLSGKEHIGSEFPAFFYPFYFLMMMAGPF